jgi:hypothetical protein
MFRWVVAWNVISASIAGITLISILEINMTALEIAKRRVELAKDALDFVKDAANQDRKLTHEKHINGHYTKALQELESVLNGAQAYLKRVEVLGR